MDKTLFLAPASISAALFVCSHSEAICRCRNRSWMRLFCIFEGPSDCRHLRHVHERVAIIKGRIDGALIDVSRQKIQEVLRLENKFWPKRHPTLASSKFRFTTTTTKSILGTKCRTREVVEGERSRHQEEEVVELMQKDNSYCQRRRKEPEHKRKRMIELRKT